MKKVAIFTTNSVEKLHPRIEMEKSILEENGYSVVIVRSTERREGFIWEIINLFTLKYFKWRAIHRFKHQINDCDIAHIYDYQLLPLAKRAFKRGKKVIYETLDDNVHLNYFAVSQKLPFLKLFKGLIIRFASNYERRITEKFCCQVIVNSPNLIEKFNKEKVVYIPYSSPMQGINVQEFSPEKETVFLYLGKLTEGKGARIYKDLIEKHDLKLLFFGKAYDAISKDFIKNDSRVECKGNLTSTELKIELEKIFNLYNPVGLSIILPENESYKWQEANKDIDYIAMGIPFIGNDRPPTLAKIENGAGVLFSDTDSVNELLTNHNNFYTRCSANSKLIAQDYTREVFEDLFRKVYK